MTDDKCVMLSLPSSAHSSSLLSMATLPILNWSLAVLLACCCAAVEVFLVCEGFADRLAAKGGRP
jgi:hypothetical protein